jgi:hypothetical protein
VTLGSAGRIHSTTRLSCLSLRPISHYCHWCRLREPAAARQEVVLVVSSPVFTHTRYFLRLPFVFAALHTAHCNTHDTHTTRFHTRQSSSRYEHGTPSYCCRRPRHDKKNNYHPARAGSRVPDPCPERAESRLVAAQHPGPLELRSVLALASLALERTRTQNTPVVLNACLRRAILLGILLDSLHIHISALFCIFVFYLLHCILPSPADFTKKAGQACFTTPGSSNQTTHQHNVNIDARHQQQLVTTTGSLSTLSLITLLLPLAI